MAGGDSESLAVLAIRSYDVGKGIILIFLRRLLNKHVELVAYGDLLG